MPATATDSARIEIELAGARVEALAGRALLWPAERTLFVADVHLGKDGAFRACGIPVPGGPTAATLARLSELLGGLSVQRLIVLGDLIHARRSRTESMLTALAAWRSAHRTVTMQLVRGNHDASAGDPPREVGIECVDEPHTVGAFLLRHSSGDAACAAARAGGYVLSGHLHPAIRLSGRADESARLPCFWFGARGAVLPAFGDFTGGALIRPEPDDRVFAITPGRLYDIPTRFSRQDLT